MSFGEKLKNLRISNNLTQDELAEKIFVSRTAVSKWETDRGFPSIESLRYLANLFHMSIDELISDEDIKNKVLIDKKNSRRFYWAAVICLAATVASAVAAYATRIYYWSVLSIIGIAGYLVFAALCKYKNQSMRLTKAIAPFIISRIVIATAVIAIAVYSVVQL